MPKAHAHRPLNLVSKEQEAIAPLDLQVAGNPAPAGPTGPGYSSLGLQLVPAAPRPVLR